MRKKTTTSLAFFLLLSSIILPVLPAITVAQEEDIDVFRRVTSSLVGDWDPAITDWYNALAEQYLWQTCEVPIGIPIYYSAGTEGPRLDTEWIGILVTDWTLHERPSQNNTLGFNNSGGYEAVTLVLRENVTFHDGSNWNATVYKWNIDRQYLINGNFTGAAQGNDDWEEEEGNLMGTTQVEDWKAYFTEDWNMSAFDSPNIGITPPVTPPGVNDYAYYDLGPSRSLVEYPGVTPLPNGTVRNPNPYGGWDSVSGAPIHYAPYDRFADVKYVEILENKASGGTVKIHYNIWNTGAQGFATNAPQLSYDEYKDEYTIHGIYGYENGVLTAPNPSIVDHMVGTGAYKFIEHDETGTPPGGHMLKNDNYWNKTALEAEGWFDAERVEVIKFPAGELGRDALNTALLTHAIDYTWDSMFMQLDLNSIQANPGIRYEAAAPSEYKTNIVMNAINETWWAWPWVDSWRQGFYPLAGNFSAGGVPMALRKAMSFAYNYPLLIQTVKNNRVVQNGGILGKANLYYNSSIPIADYNVTKAREILLTTESDISGEVYTLTNLLIGYNPDPDLYNFSKMCADRGLTASSSEAEWILVANTNPIHTLNFYFDSAHEDDKTVLETSLKAIGVALVQKTTQKVTTIIWDTVRIGHLTTFDGDHSLFSCGAWIMDEHMPHDTPQVNTFWHYVDPDRGRWREPGWAITAGHYWGNFGFNFNAEVDLYYDRIATSLPTERPIWYSKIAEIQQQEKYGVMFLYEALEGWAMWRDWETFLIAGRSGELGGIWGGVSNHMVKHVSLEGTIELIPGAPLLITMTVMAVSTIGIIYALMRKKRLR